MDWEAVECETFSIPFRWLLFFLLIRTSKSWGLRAGRRRRFLVISTRSFLTIPRFALFIFHKRKKKHSLNDISNFYCLLVNVSLNRKRVKVVIERDFYQQHLENSHDYFMNSSAETFAQYLDEYSSFEGSMNHEKESENSVFMLMACSWC